MNMKAFKTNILTLQILLCNTKGTEYESNSQLTKILIAEQASCCVIPKVLNMKAIHNYGDNK